MKFEDVRNLYLQLDCTTEWDSENHLRVQAYSKINDELLVVRFGEYGQQTFLYRLPVERPVPDRRESLDDDDGYPTGIPICCYSDGVLYAGYHYDDIPEDPKPYVPHSGEAGILDVDMSGDWQLSDVEYLKWVAEEHVNEAAYTLECSKKALNTILNN